MARIRQHWKSKKCKKLQYKKNQLKWNHKWERGTYKKSTVSSMWKHEIVISVSSFVTIQKHPDTADSNQLKTLLLHFKVDEWCL